MITTSNDNEKNIVEEQVTDSLLLLDKMEINDEISCNKNHTTELKHLKRRKRSIKSKKNYINESNNELYCQDKKARKMNYSTLCDVNVKEPRRTIAYEKYLKELLVKFHNVISMLKVIISIKAENSLCEPNKQIIGKSKYFIGKLNIPNSLSLNNRSIYIKYYPP